MKFCRGGDRKAVMSSNVKPNVRNRTGIGQNRANEVGLSLGNDK